MRIIIDDRESKSIISYARRHWEHADIEVKRLEVGDYVFPDLKIAVEMKWSFNDLASSINDDRVFRQLHNMAQNFEHSTLIIVGDYDKVYSDPYVDFPSEQWRGFRGRLMAENYSFDVEKTIGSAFKQIDSYISNCQKEPHVIRLPRPKKVKHADPVVATLMGTGISMKQAEEILNVYELYDLYTVKKSELLDIRGIGPKTADKVKGVFYDKKETN